jgi:hypothetical protein
MKNISKLAALSALFSVAMLAGCGGGGGVEPTVVPPPPPPPVAATGAVSGKVISFGTGQGIVGATVTSGGATATTGAEGAYVLSGIAPSDRAVISVKAATFAEGMSVATVVAAGTATALTKLLPVGVETTISNAVGGTVTDTSGARVALPANAFTGGAGSVTVALTAVNPSLDSSVMPGDYTINNGAQAIESFGAIIVTPRDASGNPVNLAANKTAVIRIPATSRNGVFDPTIPLLSLNPANGSWVQEGTATLAGTAPNQYYEGTVTHFSSWNADRVMETIKVNGCVKDAAGALVSGVTVRSDGIDYSGSASSATNASGTFSVAMKKSARATIAGSKGNGLLTNFLTAGPSATDITLPECLVLTEARNAVNVKLTWGQDPRDVDSHLFTPSGEHVYFARSGSLAAAPFANLDVDDTTSFGPEIITINRLMVGTYTYGVYQYSGSGTLATSPIRVELNVGGTQRIFGPPAGETATSRFVTLFKLVVDGACNVTVTPVNTWQDSVPASPASAAPAYCVAP